MKDIPIAIEAEKSPFLQQVRSVIRSQGKAYKTEQTYILWIKRFIFFVDKQHPKDVGATEVEAYLSYLAVNRRVAINTQKTALNAIAFMYRHVLGQPLECGEFTRAKVPRQLPVVFTHGEAMAVIAALANPYRMMAELMYGSGLRVSEVIRLRVKDIDFGMNCLLVRRSKGNKDRVTVLPRALLERLKVQVEFVRALHQRDLRDGAGEVYMPDALTRKYRNGASELAWQYVFPAANTAEDPRSGKERRHHVMDNSVQRRVREAVRRVGIAKKCGCHTFRPWFCHALAGRRL